MTLARVKQEKQNVSLLVKYSSPNIHRIIRINGGLIGALTMKPGKIHAQTILTCQNIPKLNRNLNYIPKLIINS